MLGVDGMVKLADFGISRRITDADSRMGTMIGTPHYLAPEVVLAENEGGYTSKVDVWSLGIVCLVRFFLFHNIIPYQSDNAK